MLNTFHFREKLWQIKAELEEQKRIRAKLEKEKIEKEKLRRVEEYKMYDEQRLKKDFEIREKHRLEVGMKKKQEKENEK